MNTVKDLVQQRGNWKDLNFQIHHRLSKFEVPVVHSVLRLDATTKKRFDRKLFKFKKISIEKASFIRDISSSRVEAQKQKKKN